MGKLWKIYKYFAVTLFTLFLVDLIVVVFFSLYRPELKKTDAAIILGAAINTPALYNRSLEGLRLYQEGSTNVLVLSGGKISNRDISEAEYMQKVIRKNSSSSVATIIEDQSHNTYENIKNSKLLLPNATSVTIVSDGYHLARGVLLAKRGGFKKVYWSSPRLPNFKNSEIAFYYIREMVAIIAYMPKFILG